MQPTGGLQSIILVRDRYYKVTNDLLFHADLVPILDAQTRLFADAFEPAFDVDGGATPVSGGCARLAIAVVGDIASREDTGNVGHGVLYGDDVAGLVGLNQALE